MNSAEKKVANRDLIQTALDFNDRLKKIEKVKYVWIAREDNQNADKLCDQIMKKIAERRA